MALDWFLDLLFSKDLVQFMDVNVTSLITRFNRRLRMSAHDVAHGQ